MRQHLNETYIRVIMSDFKESTLANIKSANLTQGSKPKFNIITTQEDTTPFQRRLISTGKDLGIEVNVINAVFTECTDEMANTPFIYETPFKFFDAKAEYLTLPDDFDVETTQHPMSACATAIKRIASEYCVRYESPHVTIVGRGEAVRGLREALAHNDVTISQCNHTTRIETMRKLFELSDAVIWAVNDPKIKIPFYDPTSRGVFIDICGAYNADLICECHSDLTYYSPSDIGKITASVIFYRASYIY